MGDELPPQATRGLNNAPDSADARPSRERVATRAAELERAGVPFVAATVVRAQRPTSARAGDTAVVHGDGVIEGFVGGSCAETSLRVHALAALDSGKPLLLRIRPGESGTTVEEGAVTVVNPCVSGGAIEIFLEPRLPPPRVLVVGDTPVARALATLGGELGLRVESVDGEELAADATVSAVIVASHGHAEEPALEAALRAGVAYVGLVASPVRGEAVVRALDADDDQRRRVHTPAGLDIGARSAAEIALSILAELVAERAQARATPAPQPVAGQQHVDPVCGMSVAAAEATPQLVQGGVTIYFCSEGCRRSFTAGSGAHPAAP